MSSSYTPDAPAMDAQGTGRAYSPSQPEYNPPYAPTSPSFQPPYSPANDPTAPTPANTPVVSAAPQQQQRREDFSLPPVSSQYKPHTRSNSMLRSDRRFDAYQSHRQRSTELDYDMHIRSRAGHHRRLRHEEEPDEAVLKTAYSQIELERARSCAANAFKTLVSRCTDNQIPSAVNVAIIEPRDASVIAAMRLASHLKESTRKIFVIDASRATIKPCETGIVSGRAIDDALRKEVSYSRGLLQVVRIGHQDACPPCDVIIVPDIHSGRNNAPLGNAMLVQLIFRIASARCVLVLKSADVCISARDLFLCNSIDQQSGACTFADVGQPSNHWECRLADCLASNVVRVLCKNIFDSHDLDSSHSSCTSLDFECHHRVYHLSQRLVEDAATGTLFTIHALSLKQVVQSTIRSDYCGSWPDEKSIKVRLLALALPSAGHGGITVDTQTLVRSSSVMLGQDPCIARFHSAHASGSCVWAIVSRTPATEAPGRALLATPIR